MVWCDALASGDPCAPTDGRVAAEAAVVVAEADGAAFAPAAFSWRVVIEYGGRVCEATVPADAVVRAVPPLRYETVVTAPGAGANPAYDSDAVTGFAESLSGAA